MEQFPKLYNVEDNVLSMFNVITNTKTLMALRLRIRAAIRDMLMIANFIDRKRAMCHNPADTMQ